MNMGYALRGCGHDGRRRRLSRTDRRAQREALLQRGAGVRGRRRTWPVSALTYMRRYPDRRAAVDIKYGEAVLAKARGRGLSAIFWDRQKEPESLKVKEGKSLDFFLWRSALAQAEGPPDIIYDKGHVGKEPIIRLFVRYPKELIKKMEMML